MYDNDGTTELNATYTTSSVTVSKDRLLSGTYYAKVRCFYPNGFAPYTLTSNLATYSYAVDEEPNKYFKQAQTIPANGTSTGHVGFYYDHMRDTIDAWKINYTGPNGGSMSIQFDLENHKSGGNDYTYFQVWKDTNASTIYTSYFAANTQTIPLTSLTQGYYYVKVFTFYSSSSNFQSYSLTPTFTETNVASGSIYNPVGNSCTNSSLQVQLSGSRPPYTVSLYRFGTLYSSTTTSQSSITINNLSPGKYNARIYGDGASAYGTTNTVNLNPPPPTNTSETSITSAAATVNWSTIACGNGYGVQYRVQGTNPWTQIIVLGNKSSLRLTGLNPGTTYEWRVAAGVGVDLSNYVASNFTPIDNFTTASGLIADASGVSSKSSSVSSGSITVNIAPNPAIDFFTIKTSVISGRINAVLYDVNGTIHWSSGLVYSENLQGKRVDVSGLLSGVYLLQIMNEKSGVIYKTKVIVQR